MKLTRRQKFIVWAEDHKWVRAIWVAWVIHRDKRLAATEFDKVVGGENLGAVYRHDGTIAGNSGPGSTRDGGWRRVTDERVYKQRVQDSRLFV